MICKYCKGDELPAGAVYCCWCGKKLKKDKAEISVPAPRRRADGLYTAQLMIKGQRVYVPAQPTEAKYYAAARALKAGFAAAPATVEKLTLAAACDRYIDERTALLSPSTIYGYTRIRHNRFQNYMSAEIHGINYQQMLNDEASKCNAKTLKNAWGFVAAALKNAKMSPPDVTLSQIAEKDLPWLDDVQIKKFIKAFEGQPDEIGALLGLHGLRRSEILAITPEKIVDGKILIRGSKVISTGGMVEKTTNKNKKSRREVPIMIPRLSELLAAAPNKPGEPYVTGTGNTLWYHIRGICEANDLPQVGVHGLRRSFVTLAFTTLGWSEAECMAVGGWSDRETMHKIYVKLSDKLKADAIKKMSDYYAGAPALPAENSKIT